MYRNSKASSGCFLKINFALRRLSCNEFQQAFETAEDIFLKIKSMKFMRICPLPLSREQSLPLLNKKE